MLTASGLVRTYGPNAAPALDHVSLSVQAGEFVAVAGPSGSGKTTLLAIVGGLDRPDAGQVTVDGEDLYARGLGALARIRNGSIGFVFQSHNLLPTLTALENVALALRCKPGVAVEAATRASRALGTLGLAEKQDRLPGRLSLGEQQRVAIARAIASRPKLLIADEPTASLDGGNGERVLDALGILASSGCAIVLASHDERCLRRADRILSLADGRLAR
jgi:putative ABC transport system ATP-binding protein